jgi:hypothetical protein
MFIGPNPDQNRIFQGRIREGGLTRRSAHAAGFLASDRYRFWLIPRNRYLLACTYATDPPRIVRLVHTSRDLPRVPAKLLD